MENSEFPDLDFNGLDATYRWYKRVAPATDWGSPIPGATTDTYIENNPEAGLEFRAEIVVPSTCRLYILTNIGVTPLPVEIIYLKANKQGNDVVLKWATAMEQNNTGFEVQVSTDGFNFRKLAFVETKNGNASIRQEYAFIDKENGKHGTRYYRLKQIDVDGTFEYCGPKAVEFGEVVSEIKAYPNPFYDEVSLDINAEVDGDVVITVTNAVGRQLLERTVRVEKGINTEKLTLDARLPNGLYIITTRMGGKTNHFKLLKQ
ncbi:MAG: T9SS type A sorting domain-containing protein [Hymenobacteraceae bacterium]|nr:T9SS type A sorting domain-containing protein [Hymenobacteraceae bacterium]